MKKSLALTLAILMVVGIAIGGTIAWLTAESKEVVNTFTTSDITVDLKETTGENYQMIPGYTLEKDPVVTVKKGSEDAWVFIEAVESDNLDDYISYEIDPNNWTELEEGVYYIKYASRDDVDISIKVLKENKVTVKEDVTKADMEAAKTNAPSLSFKAYAVQYMKNNTENFTAEEAWAKINP